MNNIKIKKLPKECFDIYDQYNNVPYYINKSKNKFLKDIKKGKASPKQIDQFILNNNKKLLKGKKKYDFLKTNKIGVDLAFIDLNHRIILKQKQKRTEISKIRSSII